MERRRPDLVLGAVFALSVCPTLAACRAKGAPQAALERKPTIQEAIAASKLPPMPTGPVVPARRTHVVTSPGPARPPEDAALVALGKRLFSDATLSEPAGTSCASCHDPQRAFSGSHGSTLGVPLGSRADHFARRSTPSVLYLRYVPKFHFFEDDEAPYPAPFGGFFWDGRSDTISELVRQPLFNPDEMNAGAPRRVAAKLLRAPYAKELRTLAHGANPESLLRAFGAALEAYLTSDEMTPATSKFDAWVRGEATLTDQEKRGLEAFKDGTRGACAACHRLNELSTNPQNTMFTDYGYDSVGVPRNRALPSNEAPGSYDLGLCERKDRRTPSSDDKWCTSFRTPSLRNVAVRDSFMHNGQFKKLRDVVAFYAHRASSPDRFYPAGQRFDDVPAKYRDNINLSSFPYNRPEGGKPALSDEEIDAIVAFLETLTDAAFLPAKRPS